VRECFRENPVLRWAREVIVDREIRAPIGHHEFDAGAVLGGVQGSTLRFDRALARPSGLDAASAQLLSGQLRDGRECDADVEIPSRCKPSPDRPILLGHPMSKTLQVHGLARFGLTPTTLMRLGPRTVRLSLQLRGRTVQEVADLTPRRRMSAVRASLASQLERLEGAFPELKFVPRGGVHASWTVDVAARAEQAGELARRREVTAVYVDSVEGHGARKPRLTRAWFCVWAIIAVQIEGRRKGSVTVEDRLVLVKAFSAKEAESRVRRKTNRETKPYLNSDGELVRWLLVSVKDVFELFDDVIDPDGTEVYSKLRSTRMRPELSWPSRATKRSGDRVPKGARQRTGSV
jgi:hypothetical protein